MRMSSAMSTPVSLANTSTPSSPLSSADELLEFDQVDQALHRDIDLQSRLKLAESRNAEALSSLQKTQHRLKALEAKHEELIEANQAVTQSRDDLERQREEWAAAKFKFAKRHLENKTAKKVLETKYSAAALELNDVLERYLEAQEEITKLKDEITALLSPLSTALPDVDQDPPAADFHPWIGQDQCLALSVQGTLFRVSRRLLMQDSQYFEDLLVSNQAFGNGQTGMNDAHPIILDGVQVEEMSDFLTFLYKPPFQTNFDLLEIRQWAAILKLATLWSFSATRAYAISIFDTKLAGEDSFDRLERAFACAVPKWVRPAYDAICRRWESLSADEGRRLGWERYAAICRIREDVARGTLDVSLGYHGHLIDFSEQSPTLRAMEGPDHRSNTTPVMEETHVLIEPAEHMKAASPFISPEELHERFERPVTPMSAVSDDNCFAPTANNKKGKWKASNAGNATPNVLEPHQAAISIAEDLDLRPMETTPASIIEELPQYTIEASVSHEEPIPGPIQRIPSPTPEPTPVLFHPINKKLPKGKKGAAIGDLDWEDNYPVAANLIPALALESEPTALPMNPKVESTAMPLPHQPNPLRDIPLLGGLKDAPGSRRETSRRPPSPTLTPSTSLFSPPSMFNQLTAAVGQQAKVTKKSGWGGLFAGWGDSQLEEPVHQQPPPSARVSQFDRNRASMYLQAGRLRDVPRLGRSDGMFSSGMDRFEPASAPTAEPIRSRAPSRVPSPALRESSPIPSHRARPRSRPPAPRTPSPIPMPIPLKVEEPYVLTGKRAKGKKPAKKVSNLLESGPISTPAEPLVITGKIAKGKKGARNVLNIVEPEPISGLVEPWVTTSEDVPQATVARYEVGEVVGPIAPSRVPSPAPCVLEEGVSWGDLVGTNGVRR
ncbi:hypothetical protein FRB97_002365 [Tulasnella sp. 331]|nr:hypothetical protein FRB97_002365 [Tulasnella sp. 331]